MRGLTPVALFVGYLLVMFTVFLLGFPGEVESALLALPWVAGLAVAVRIGPELVSQLDVFEVASGFSGLMLATAYLLAQVVARYRTPPHDAGRAT